MFEFLDNNIIGVFIFVCLAILLLLALLLCMWAFNLGRFKVNSGVNRVGTGAGVGADIPKFLGDFVINIINEFRHLLALMVVSIFGLVIFIALIVSGSSVKEMASALQAVMATIGSLVGLIIGYYFGETRSKEKTAVQAVGTNSSSDDDLINSPDNSQMKSIDFTPPLFEEDTNSSKSAIDFSLPDFAKK